jgi:hypothetical protein
MMRLCLIAALVLIAGPAWGLPGDGVYRGTMACGTSLPHPTTGLRHPGWSRQGLTLTITNGSLRGDSSGQHRSGVPWAETWNGAVRDQRVSVLAQGQDSRNDPWFYTMTGEVPTTPELVLHGAMYVLNQRHRVCWFRGQRI